VFIPRMETRRVKNGRVVSGTCELFPGYGFVQQGDCVIDVLRRSRYVANVLQVGGVLARVPGRVVDELKSVVGPTDVMPYRVKDGFVGGQIVVIGTGPFVGLAGKYHSMSGARRCRVLLRMLGQDIAVSVDVGQLKTAA
jgi:transcription antitermination factor NusG